MNTQIIAIGIIILGLLGLTKERKPEVERIKRHR